MEKLFEELQHAKKAVRWLLDNESGMVDFHDVCYWVYEVVRLRKAIKDML